MRASLIALALAAGLAAPAQAARLEAARLPGFAAELSHRSLAESGRWAPIADADAWAALVRAAPRQRQAARWNFARSLIGRERGGEAIGVLDVMFADDPDLALVPAFQLARGAALAQIGRAREAALALSAPELARLPEACAWRLRVLPAREALAEVECALAAINSRVGTRRRAFSLAAIHAALDAGDPGQALTWLAGLGQRDADANLLRGRAMLATGRLAAARKRFERAARTGGPEAKVAARLGMIETDGKARKLAPAAAIQAIEMLRYGWRGGDVERRALRLEFELAAMAHDNAAMLRTGATLFRFFNLGAEATPTLTRLQALLGTMLAPESGIPVAQAAGFYWDYRDLAPAGGDGDLLVGKLAERLQAESLYARAAELLQYQLTRRTDDVAQGPLSVKVATLLILSGQPDRALDALRASEGPDYPDAMRWERKRIEAVALDQAGKTDAALAALDDVPGGDAIRAEIRWNRRDWEGLVREDAAALPPPRTLSEVQQAVVLRHAVALAMLGREDDLGALRARYGAAFASLPTAAAFDALTRSPAAVEPGALGAAMAAIPSASPAGKIADLMAATPEG